VLRHLRSSFNSATAVRPWRTPRQRPPSQRVDSFNSATAVRPWRTTAPRIAGCDLIRLQFGHGGEAVEDSTPHFPPNCRADKLQFSRARGRGRWRSPPPRARASLVSGFNSATAVRPWRTLPAPTVTLSKTPLQFGHGGEAVEDDADPLSPQRKVHDASIRPRR